MDLETIRAASRIGRYQEGETYSRDVQEQLDRLSELSYEEKEKLMAEAFSRALTLADDLAARPEYDAETGVLDLSGHGLSKVDLRIYHDDGDDETKPFDGITVDIGGVYAQHQTIGELHDEMVFVNRDGTVEKVHDGFDRHVHATLEYLETLEVIQKQLVSQPVTA